MSNINPNSMPKPGSCPSCSEQVEFDWHSDGPNPNPGGDALTYTFEVLK